MSGLILFGIFQAPYSRPPPFLLPWTCRGLAAPTRLPSVGRRILQPEGGERKTSVTANSPVRKGKLRQAVQIFTKLHHHLHRAAKWECDQFSRTLCLFTFKSPIVSQQKENIHWNVSVLLRKNVLSALSTLSIRQSSGKLWVLQLGLHLSR